MRAFVLITEVLSLGHRSSKARAEDLLQFSEWGLGAADLYAVASETANSGQGYPSLAGSKHQTFGLVKVTGYQIAGLILTKQTGSVCNVDLNANTAFVGQLKRCPSETAIAGYPSIQASIAAPTVPE